MSNGQVQRFRESLICFPNIGVDFDDTCVETGLRFVQWHNLMHRTKFTVEDLQAVGNDYGKLLGCNATLWLERFKKFHIEYYDMLDPIFGSQAVLKRLAQPFTLDVVTYRSDDLKKYTALTAERLFPETFTRFCHLGFKKGEKTLPTTKAQICEAWELGVLIEDSLANALSCARTNANVILLDLRREHYERRLHANIIVTHSWQEIEEIILG